MFVVSYSKLLLPRLTCVFALSFYKKRVCGWLGSSCRLRYFNIQKTLHFVVIACCVCLWVFFVERLCGLFVVIDFTIEEIVFRVCLLCLFWGCFCLANAGIDCRGCFRGWLKWLLFLVVLDWMIVCCYCISWLILW